MITAIRNQFVSSRDISRLGRNIYQIPELPITVIHTHKNCDLCQNMHIFEVKGVIYYRLNRSQ